MAEQTPRMQAPYPSRETDPWYDEFVNYVNAVDASSYAYREDRHLIFMGGGTIAWDLATEMLSWTEDLLILSGVMGRFWFLNGPGSIELSATNGIIWYTEVNRAPGDNTQVDSLAANTLQAAAGNNALAIAVRYNDAIYFRTGVSIGDGESISGISPTPGGGLEVEDEGVSVDPATVLLDFVGAGVTATQTAPGAVEVNIPGGAADKHTARYIVGNSLAGDTLAECHYLDPGDGSGIEAALAAAALTSGDVWIRPGTYDLGIGGTPTESLTIPQGVMVRGAGKDHVTIVTATDDGLDNHAFVLNDFSTLMDVGIYCPTPEGYMSPASSYVVDCVGFGALVQRVRISFEFYWSSILDPYYVEYTYGAFGCSGFFQMVPNNANKFVDDEVASAPYDLGYDFVLLEHATFGGGLCQVERFYGEGGTTGIKFGEAGHINNSVVENNIYSFWNGISVRFADKSIVLGNRVIGLFNGGNGSKAYKVIGSGGVVMSNNFAEALAASSGADFLDISQSDNGSFIGNVGVGFVDGIALNSFSDDNEVIGNNVAGAVITDAGTGNDLAHNK